MVEVRACVYFSVIFLCFNIISGKPIFTTLVCNLLCEDDDGITTLRPTTTNDIWDDWCSFCDFARPAVATTIAPPPAVTNPMPPPFSVIIPASPNAMNLTMWNNPATSGSWFMNMMPWGGMQPAFMPTPAAQVATTTAAAEAAPTTAAAATTAAAGAATTAAPAPAAPAA